MVGMAVDALYDAVGSCVEIVKILNKQFGTTTLVFLPIIETNGCGEICEAHDFIKLAHIRGIDGSNGKLSGAYIIIADEIGGDAVVDLQVELVGHLLGYDQLVTALFAGEFGQGASRKVAIEKCDIIIASDTLERNTHEIGIGLENALAQSVTFYMFDARYVLDGICQRVINADWGGHGRL